MRFSTIASLLVSLLLAAIAVFGVRTYLDNQRTLLASGGKGEAVSNTIVVADKPLRFGQLIRDEDLRELPWPSKVLPAGVFRSKSELVGEGDKARYVMSPMEKDEPVLKSKITGPGQRATLSATLSEGMKAMSIRVNDVLGVSGFVLPGDRVDVLLTRTGQDGKPYVDVLLQGLKVLAINQNADERSDKPNVSKTVTFEVSTEEAQKLTLASSIGTLSLALRNVASSQIEAIQPVTESDLGGAPVSEDLQSARVKEQDERFGKIETLVKNVGSNLENRIGSVEEKLNEQSNKVPVEQPDPVTVATPRQNYVVIGVSRNGNRNEYRVSPAE